MSYYLHLRWSPSELFHLTFPILIPKERVHLRWSQKEHVHLILSPREHDPSEAFVSALS